MSPRVDPSFEKLDPSSAYAPSLIARSRIWCGSAVPTPIGLKLGSQMSKSCETPPLPPPSQ